MARSMVGSRIRELRLEQGLTQEELAGPSLNASYISMIESGRRTPGDTVLITLAERLGVTPDYLEHGEPASALGQVSRTEQLVTMVTWSFPKAHEQLLASVLAAVHDWRTRPGHDTELLEQLRGHLDKLQSRATTSDLQPLFAPDPAGRDRPARRS